MSASEQSEQSERSEREPASERSELACERVCERAWRILCGLPTSSDLRFSIASPFPRHPSAGIRSGNLWEPVGTKQINESSLTLGSTYPMHFSYTGTSSVAAPGPCVGPGNVACPGAFTGPNTKSGTPVNILVANAGVSPSERVSR